MLLSISKSTQQYANKNPTNVGLDDVKEIGLF